MHFIDFRIGITESMLQNITLPKLMVNGRPLRMQVKFWAHFWTLYCLLQPDSFLDGLTKSAKGITRGQKTAVQEIPLHLESCFEAYLTFRDH
jgi:hypothetical protein